MTWDQSRFLLFTRLHLFANHSRGKQQQCIEASATVSTHCTRMSCPPKAALPTVYQTLRDAALRSPDFGSKRDEETVIDSISMSLSAAEALLSASLPPAPATTLTRSHPSDEECRDEVAADALRLALDIASEMDLLASTFSCNDGKDSNGSHETTV
jgi:hypothetical protein